MQKFQKRFAEVDRKRIVRLAKSSLRSSEGAKALEYLKDVRGLSDKVIDDFNMGYVPSEIPHQLRGRIITPIYDPYGKLVAISTKSLLIKKGDKGHFWHEDYDKRFYIYGLSNAKKNIISCQKVILVEGEMGVAFLHSKGFDIAVGVCGSSFSIYQACMLSRYCTEVYLAFDPDQSGSNALKRTMDMYQQYNFNSFGMKFIPTKFPNYTKSDDYLKEYGNDEFKKILIMSKNNSY